MSIKNDNSSLPTTSHKRHWDPLSDCRTHKFRVQSTPPLSLRQFFRSTITVVPGAEQWKPAGIYHVPIVHEDPTSKSNDSQPEIREKSRKSSQLPWYPAGCVKYVPPASPNNVKVKKSERITTDSRTDTDSNLLSKSTKETVIPWHPSGNKKYKAVPYFDAPSLRWTLQDVKQSMPQLRTKTNNNSTKQK